jgi:hypothetical protein
MNYLISELNAIKDKESFSEKIKDSKYIQNISMNNGLSSSYKNIADLILVKYEPMLSFGKSEPMDINKYKIKISEELDDNYSNYHLNNKVLSLKKIQNGFHEKNSLSSLYFLSEYYKSNFNILDLENDKLYFTNYKNYENEYILYSKGSFSCVDKHNTNSHPNSIFNCDFLNIDLKSEYIYKTELKAISNYTLKELKEKVGKGTNILDKKGLYLKLYKLNLNK